jgi:hypothetical protein
MHGSNGLPILSIDTGPWKFDYGAYRDTGRDSAIINSGDVIRFHILVENML